MWRLSGEKGYSDTKIAEDYRIYIGCQRVQASHFGGSTAIPDVAS